MRRAIATSSSDRSGKFVFAEATLVFDKIQNALSLTAQRPLFCSRI